jgi:glycosyltransferase involved in cell wall biosynthesis
MLNVLVCGRFHYHKYVAQLREMGVLNKVYFSHKIGQSLGLENSFRRNFFLKEYLLNAHLRTFGDLGLPQMLPLYTQIWSKQVLRELDVAESNLLLAVGTGLEIIDLCKRRGGNVIVEVVTAHPGQLSESLALEHERLGIPFKLRRGGFNERIIEEASGADVLLAPSKVVANSYVSRGIDARKIIVLNYGAFPSSGRHLTLKQGMNSVNSPNRSFKILCVGQIAPWKGQIYLARAIKLLNETGVSSKIELTLVGRVDKTYFLKVVDIGLRFRHIVHIDNSQMCEFMGHHDLLVLPSIEDGFGIVIGEALSAGIPVITTSSAGAADIVERINPALVVPPGNHEKLAHAILQVMENDIELEPIFINGWMEYATHLIDEATSFTVRQKDSYADQTK